MKKMKNEIVIKMKYFTHGFMPEIKGTEDFQKEMSDEYLFKIQKMQGGLGGGGIVEFITEIFVNNTIADYLFNVVMSGVIGNAAYDYIKNGNIKFNFSALFNNVKKIQEKNNNSDDCDLNIGQTKIEFQDVEIIIENIYPNSIPENFNKILNTLRKFIDNGLIDIKNIMLIHLPLYQYKDNGGSMKYSPLNIMSGQISTGEDFFKYWGLIEKNYTHKVVDIHNQTISEQYWEY